MSKIATDICNAIDIIVDKRMGDLKFDKTIQGIVQKCTNTNTGEYQVKYQDSIIIAYDESTAGSPYESGTPVYIQIPTNDFNLKKQIIGSVTGNVPTGISTNWYGIDIPSISSYPASGWVSAGNDVVEYHVGDTYYRTITGAIYVFTKIPLGNEEYSYEWVVRKTTIFVGPGHSEGIDEDNIDPWAWGENDTLLAPIPNSSVIFNQEVLTGDLWACTNFPFNKGTYIARNTFICMNAEENIWEVLDGAYKPGMTSIDGAVIQAQTISAEHIVAGSITINEINSANVGSGLNLNDNETINNITNELADKATKQELENITTTLKLDGEGLSITQSDSSTLKIVISNDRIEFHDGGSIPAYINGQTMHIDTLDIVTSIGLGNHQLEKYTTANKKFTLVKFVG